MWAEPLHPFVKCPPIIQDLNQLLQLVMYFFLAAFPSMPLCVILYVSLKSRKTWETTFLEVARQNLRKITLLSFLVIELGLHACKASSLTWIEYLTLDRQILVFFFWKLTWGFLIHSQISQSEHPLSCIWFSCLMTHGPFHKTQPLKGRLLHLWLKWRKWPDIIQKGNV